MSSKVDTVVLPRELTPEMRKAIWDTQHDTCENTWAAVIAAAPVVERQPVAEVSDMKYNRVQFYRATGDTTKPYLLPGTKLYIAPPELAELQAAVAQQAAEIELLKGGLPGLTFRYQHPLTKEIRSASLTKTEVADGMEDTLYEKLVAQFCQCESVGETNVVDCNCDEYIHDFDLVADDTKAEQPAS